MDYRRSSMVYGQIQLGTKKGSGKSLDREPTQGFFYGGQVDEKPKAMYVRTINPVRQCLILQNYGVAQSGRAQRKAEIRFKSCPVSFFYDNPTRKRLARCTNTIHTGATLQVWANEQRLRKGFQGRDQSNGVFTNTKNFWRGKTHRNKIQWEIRPVYPLSLSSAAENKAFSEKYEVTVDITLPWLYS